MTRPIVGIAAFVFGLVTLSVAGAVPAAWRALALAAAAILLAAGGALLITYWRRGNDADLMRLNWFLPFLRKKGRPAGTRTPSRTRRLLRRLGPSVVASPVRRLVQALCLLLFLVLFYYVCWPYTARPAPPGQQSSGWTLVRFEQATGEVVLAHDAPADWIVAEGRTVYVMDQSQQDVSSGSAGAFTVRVESPTQIALLPESSNPAAQCDVMLTSPGPWRLYERPPDQWPSHYADDLARKEVVAAELFLVLDPLVSLSTAIAARSWVWSLSAAAVILLVCVLVPRGFCGYICPLGTVIDLFDWSIGRRVTRFRVSGSGWWVHLKYYLLSGVLVCAVWGVLVSGFVAAIPVVTRGLLFVTEPLQSGILRGWHQVPAIGAGQIISIALFVIVLGLGLLQPRFWCRYVCPSGAVFSVSNLFRATERKVETTCIHCNKCVEICPFDAIKPDFTTRVSDCTFCQSCGGVCPTHAIKFVERWNQLGLKTENDPPTGDTPIGRRGFLSWAAGSTAALSGGLIAAAAVSSSEKAAADTSGRLPVRPPGSVPEPQFLQLCIRCGECFKVCPNNVLQAEGFQQGLAGLWAPQVVADWAGCESSCNACGQVCPTGAIRALPLEEKRVARMGLAIVNEQTCLPFANREACQLCVDECNAAGYEAIEFMRVHTQVDSQGLPIDGSGHLAPVVAADRCVGCGLCQTRCYGINVKTKHLLERSAIVIEAGPGKEDRLMSGSYVELRDAEAQQREQQHEQSGDEQDFFLPEPAGDAAPESTSESADPFGL